MPVTKENILDGLDERSSSRVDVIVGANPAAGAEVSETVPAGETWCLLGVRVTLVTSATVATRQPILTLDDGTNIFFENPAAST